MLSSGRRNTPVKTVLVIRRSVTTVAGVASLPTREKYQTKMKLRVWIMKQNNLSESLLAEMQMSSADKCVTTGLQRRRRRGGQTSDVTLLVRAPPGVGGVKVKKRTSERRMKAGGVWGGGGWFFDGSCRGRQSALTLFHQLLTARGTSGSAATVPSERDRRLRGCIRKHVYALLLAPKPEHQCISFLLQLYCISIRVWIKLRGCHASKLQASLPICACLFTHNRAESAFHESWCPSEWWLIIFLSLSLCLSFIAPIGPGSAAHGTW